MVKSAGCDLDGYPLHAPQPEISEQMSVRQADAQNSVGLSQQFLAQRQFSVNVQMQNVMPTAPSIVRSQAARIAALEMENAQLRGLLDRIEPAPRERLSAGWEHLRDIAAPELRTMPARALARGKMVIGVRA